jgi:hypothetical protein
MIVFDYNVPLNCRNPPVIAFTVKRDGSKLIFDALHDPSITVRVNDDIEFSTRHRLNLPNRTDLRYNKDERKAAKNSRVVSSTSNRR